jgi:hypothetical protein
MDQLAPFRTLRSQPLPGRSACANPPPPPPQLANTACGRREECDDVCRIVYVMYVSIYVCVCVCVCVHRCIRDVLSIGMNLKPKNFNPEIQTPKPNPEPEVLSPEP